MKYIFLTFFLYNITFLKSSCQDSLKIQYVYNDPIGNNEVYELETNGIKSNFNFIESISIDPTVIKKDYNFNNFMYKNFLDSTIYCSVGLFSKNFYLKDSLFNINWQILNNSKSILGYQCFEAETEFRGRKIIAFFTPMIPYADGPWKFSGLPGLILEVRTDDGQFSYIAKSISNSTVFTKRIDISTYKFISYLELCLQYRKTIDNMIRAAQAEEADDPLSSSSIKITKLEIIYPKFQ